MVGRYPVRFPWSFDSAQCLRSAQDDSTKIAAPTQGTMGTELFMRLYHATSKELAGRIEREGFRATENTDGCHDDEVLRGVFFSDRPLREQDGTNASGSLFTIDVDEKQIAQYEIKTGCADYRQWCIPGDVANRLLANRGELTSRVRECR